MVWRRWEKSQSVKSVDPSSKQASKARRQTTIDGTYWPYSSSYVPDRTVQTVQTVLPSRLPVQ